VAYDTHLLWSSPSKLVPGSIGINSAGIGAPALARAMPPQSGQHAIATTPVPAATSGEDCPSCNLVEIPYNPNLPVLRV
jgi:hypothetical protein